MFRCTSGGGTGQHRSDFQSFCGFFVDGTFYFIGSGARWHARRGVAARRCWPSSIVRRQLPASPRFATAWRSTWPNHAAVVRFWRRESHRLRRGRTRVPWWPPRRDLTAAKIRGFAPSSRERNSRGLDGLHTGPGRESCHPQALWPFTDARLRQTAYMAAQKLRSSSSRRTGVRGKACHRETAAAAEQAVDACFAARSGGGSRGRDTQEFLAGEEASFLQVAARSAAAGHGAGQQERRRRETSAHTGGMGPIRRAR